MNSPSSFGRFRSRIQPSPWLAIATGLCFLTLLASIFLHNHQPPIGVYIAIMGVAAAAVTFRKEPSLAEKAAWIVLLTMLMVLEVKNLYSESDKQAKTFKQIADGLAETSGKLTQDLNGLQAIKRKQDETYNDTKKNIKESSSILLQRVQSSLVPGKMLKLAIVLDAPKLTREQFRFALEESPTKREGFHLGYEALRKIICGDRDRIPFVEFSFLLSGQPRVNYVLRRKIRKDLNNREMCNVDSSLEIYDATGKSSVPINTDFYVGPTALGKGAGDRGTVVLRTEYFLPDEKFPDQPLYASSFNGRYATLSLSGEDEDVIIFDAVKALEPAVPLSIAVDVQGWFVVPVLHMDQTPPAFEKIWYLERMDRFDSNAGEGAEYKFVP